MDIEAAKKLLAAHPLKDDELRRMRRGGEYYRNRTNIVNGGSPLVEFAKDWQRAKGINPLRTADNRIPTNWHKIFVDQKVGYLFTYPPRFDLKESANGELVVDKINEVLGDYYEKVIKQLGTDASNAGRAWLAYWYDSEKPFEYWFLPPDQVTPIYDPASIKPSLKALIRRYSSLNELNQPIMCAEIWDDKEAVYLAQKGKADFEAQCGVKPHQYGCVPFIEFRNNENCTSDLDMYQQIIDAVDKVISGLANDLDDIQELLFVLKNYVGETSEIDYVPQPDGTTKEVPREISPVLQAKLRKYFLVDGDGGVDVLRAEIPFEARKAYLDMLVNLLYVAAMAVNPAPDKTGNQSGVYIDFLYSLLELKSGLMETEFRPAMGCFVRAVLRYLGKPENTPVRQIWTRNKPRNEVETAQIISSTSEAVMSDETKTQVHPLVEDWKAERKKIKAEQKERRKQYETPDYPPDGDTT